MTTNEGTRMDQSTIDKRKHDQESEDIETLFKYSDGTEGHHYGQCQMEYLMSKASDFGDAPFYALIMAAMRNADTFNAIKLRRAFPELWLEMVDRYEAPRGLLEGEHDLLYKVVDSQLIEKQTGEVKR
jgi:hypothetical protein